VLVEAYNSISKVERYYKPLRCLYEILRDELQDEKLDKEIILQIAVKAVNDIARLDRLMLTLLIFSIYPRLTLYNTLLLSIVKRVEAICTAIKELCRFYAER
jgi:hypothetical protein